MTPSEYLDAYRAETERIAALVELVKCMDSASPGRTMVAERIAGIAERSDVRAFLAGGPSLNAPHVTEVVTEVELRAGGVYPTVSEPPRPFPGIRG